MLSSLGQLQVMPHTPPLTSLKSAQRSFDRLGGASGQLFSRDPHTGEPDAYRSVFGHSQVRLVNGEELPDMFAALSKSYITPEEVIVFLRQEPSLARLFFEAVAPLQESFGSTAVLRLSLLVSDDDYLLKAVAVTRVDSDPERLLSDFDERWWIHNCRRSHGLLVFDYEIQDAF